MLNALFVNHWKVAASARQDILKSSFVSNCLLMLRFYYTLIVKNNVGIKKLQCVGGTLIIADIQYFIYFSQTLIVTVQFFTHLTDHQHIVEICERNCTCRGFVSLMKHVWLSLT